jgi:hypothetical protein
MWVYKTKKWAWENRSMKIVMRNLRIYRIITSAKEILSIVLVGFLLAGCTVALPTQTHQHTNTVPEATSTEKATSTPLEVASVPTETITKNIYQAIKFDGFSPGEYLVYFRNIGDPKLYSPVLYSIDGKQVGELPPVTIGLFSPNLHFLENLPLIIDLTDGSKMRIEEVDWCGEPSWSSDNKSIIAVCGNQNTHNDIFSLSLKSNSVTQLTQCDIAYTLCDSPSISPDGKWIAYYFSAQKAGGIIEENGLHVMDTECISSNVPCKSILTNGMNSGPPYSWSPDSQYVTGESRNLVNIYKIFPDRIILNKVLTLDSHIERALWSPSGNWIAAETDNGVSIISVETWKITKLDMKYFYYWINIP